MVPRWPSRALTALALAFAGLASATATAGAAPAASTAWKQEHFDAGHSGFNPFETTLSGENVASLVAKWSASIHVRVQASPVVAGGMVYTAGADLNDPSASHAVALHAATGNVLWTAKQPNAGDALGIAVCNGRVFLTTLFDHALRAYEATTGDLLWSLHLDGAPESPTLGRGRIYFQTNVGTVYAVDPDSGAIMWQRSFAERPNASPALYRGRLFVTGHSSRKIRALDADDGRVRWEKTLPDFTESSPTVVDGIVYESVATAGTYALSAASGALVWHRGTPDAVVSPVSVDDSSAYVGDVDGVLYAFDRATGQPRWSRALGGRFGNINSPVVANGVVYAATTGIFALDAGSGKQLWSGPTGTVGSDPAVLDGVLYVGDFDGNLRAFHLPSSN